MQPEPRSPRISPGMPGERACDLPRGLSRGRRRAYISPMADDVSERLAALERRLDRLEALLAGPVRVPVPQPSVLLPAVELPASVPPVARPSLEQAIGLRWAGWVGAIVLVIGAGLGIDFAYRQGWFNGIPPAARVLSLVAVAAALIGVGEIVLPAGERPLGRRTVRRGCGRAVLGRLRRVRLLRAVRPRGGVRTDGGRDGRRRGRRPTGRSGVGGGAEHRRRQPCPGPAPQRRPVTRRISDVPAHAGRGRGGAGVPRRAQMVGPPRPVAGDDRRLGGGRDRPAGLRHGNDGRVPRDLRRPVPRRAGRVGGGR